MVNVFAATVVTVDGIDESEFDFWVVLSNGTRILVALEEGLCHAVFLENRVELIERSAEFFERNRLLAKSGDVLACARALGEFLDGPSS